MSNGQREIMVLVKMTCIGHCKIVMQFSGGPKDAFEFQWSDFTRCIIFKNNQFCKREKMISLTI